MNGSWCVFLRGINVGGVNIKMADLKQAFAELGFTEVQTLLASGNVICTAPEGQADRAALAANIERGLSARFGYEAHLLLRDRAEIAAVVEVAQAMTVPEGTHQYVLFCDDSALPAELEALYESLPHTPGERFLQAGPEAIWLVPAGSTLASDFGSKVLGSKKYKSRLTSRNINTVEKALKLMA